MKDQLLEAENIEESVIAADSTGFSPGQASLYYRNTEWTHLPTLLKGVYAIRTQSQYLLAWQPSDGPSTDTAHWNVLKRSYARFWYPQPKQTTYLADAWWDAGFDGESFCSLDFVLPTRRHGKLVDPDRRALEPISLQPLVWMAFSGKLEAQNRPFGHRA